jgi:hypothetical protein
MTMGHTGMFMDHQMGGPENTLPMGTPGPFGDLIDMGGMFTVLKVRDNLASYDDPGWYRTENDPVWYRYNPGGAPSPERAAHEPAAEAHEHQH